MSKVIDERVVEMRFDNKEFESGVKTSMSTLDKLKQSLNFGGTAKSFDELNRSASGFEKTGLANAIETVSLKFSALEVMAVTALANITNTAINAGKQIISALTIEPIKVGFAEYELKMGSIQTIMAGTGESLETVNRYLDDLNTYADKTIYSFADMTSNIGKFTNAGVSLKDSVAAIQGIANVAAVSGANTNEASRAMYNFAQALSAGYVKFIDWKSIELANMATVEFKTQLLEAAVAAGTLTKNLDGTYTTLKGTVITASRGFNDSLEEQWMTTEALVKTLNDYADETTDIGKKASAAATEVKTLSQLFDTLKEAAGSGWAKTWELIIGDFNEAKDLLTGLNAALGGFIDNMSDSRNDLLFGALASGWKQLMNEGIADSEGFQQTVASVAKEHGISIDQMIEDAGSFEKSLKNGWLTSDILAESIEKLTAKFEGLSEEEIAQMGYTLEDVEALEKLNSAVKDGSISMEEFAEKMTKASGRELLFDSLMNAAKGLLSVLKPVGDAFREVFPATTSERLHGMIVSLNEFTAKLKMGDETSDKLKRTFAGLFAVLDLLRQGFLFVWRVAGEVFGLFGGPTVRGILDVTASFGDFLVKINEAAKQGDIFNRAFEGVKTVMTTVADKIRDAVDRISKAFGGFRNIDMGPLDDFASNAETKFKPIERLGQIFGAAFEAIVKVLEWAAPIVSKLGSIVATGLGALADKISYAVENMEFNEILDLINAGLFGAILVGIRKFISSLTDITSGAGGFMDGIVGILDGVRGALEAYQSNLQAKTLLTIAGAVGILAASLVALSLIDSEKLSGALMAITVLFVELAASMIVIQKAMGGGKMTKVSLQMVAMGTAILILSKAMQNLASLDWAGVAKGTIGVATLAATLVIAANSLDKSSGKLIKGSTGLIAFAAAILIMSEAVKKMSGLGWEELAKGLTGLTVILAEVVAITHLMGDSKRMVSTGVGMIALGAAMLIFAEAVERMGQLSWGEIARGLTTMAGALTAITVAMNLLPKGMINKAAGLVVVGSALLIIGDAVKGMGAMSWEEIARGLVTLAGSLGAITLALNLMPKGMITKAVGLIGIATALTILVDPLKEMGGMSWEEIAKGLVTLAGSMTILAVALNAMQKALPGAAAMLIVAPALAIMAGVLKTLGNMALGEIGTGLLALAGIFAVFGVSALVLQPLVPTMIALAAAIALLGVGVLAVGVGILALAAGLTALSVSATAAAGAIVVIGSAVLSLIPILFEKIGEGIIAMGGVIINGAPIIKDAFLVLLASALEAFVEAVPMIAEAVLKLLVALLDALVKYTPTIVESIFDLLIGILNAIAAKLPTLIKAAIDVLMAFFSGVVDALSGIDVDVLVKGIAGIGLMSAIMLALAAVATLIPAAMVGVLGMGVVIAELALVLAAVGALAQIPGLSWLIGEGGKLLQGIGTAIGQFIGGIVGGFMSGVSSQFQQIGADLSAFMVNVTPFIEGAAKIDPSMLDGVNALAKTILILTAASILDGLASWFTGSSSLAKFGEELIPFGRAMKEFSRELAGMDGSVVANAATAGKTLAEMANTVPRSGGVVDFFAGTRDMGAFGDQLIPFGRALKRFSVEVSGIDGSAVANSAIAGKAMAEMAATIPNTGGLVSFFTGNNDMSTFGEQLIPFGKAIKAYSVQVQGLDAAAVTNSATAGQALFELAKTIPNTGGLVSWFTGNNDIDAFGTQIVVFGKAIKQYATSVAGIDAAVVTNSASAGKALIELANSLPNTGGLVSWFTGDNDIASFGTGLVSFGQSFAAYYQSVSVINTATLSSVVVEFKKIADLARGLVGLDTSGMSSFAQNLKNLGNNGIDAFISAFTNATSKVSTAATNMMTAFINAAKAKQGELTTTFTTMIQAVLTAIQNKQGEFQSSGQNSMVKFIAGVKSQDSTARSTYTTIISACLTILKDKYGEFQTVGQQTMVKFIAGVKSQDSAARSAYTTILTACLTAIKNTFSEFQSAGQETMTKFIAGVKSKDSAVKEAFTANLEAAVSAIKDYYTQFYNAGKYLVEGFAEGITANTYLAEARSRAMAAAAARAAERELDEHSPSKVGYRIGDFFGLGFVNAIATYASKAYDASANMASSAKSGLSDVISRVADVFDNDVDFEPVIKPVLDLTDVEKGTRKLSAMFSHSQVAAISSEVNRGSEARIQNGGNVQPANVNYNFTQNNTSPKALSRLEIYRQTKNQFAVARGLVEGNA